MKTCFKCLETKPLTEFYPHKQMADGHLNKCKECTKRDAMNARRADPERHRAKKREQSRDNPLQVARSAAYQNDPLGRLVCNAAKAKWIANNSEKRKAHSILYSALKSGKLQKQPCFICGDEAEAHHSAYDLPLHVTWLCSVHHKLAHREHRDRLRHIGGSSHALPSHL